MRIISEKKVILLVILVIIFSSKIYASSYIFNQIDNESNMSKNYIDKSKYDYIIENYDIDMVVNEDNTFDITEKITAYFNVAKHRNL